MQPVTNPLDLWYLCEKINYALSNPLIDKDGSRQYQRVVTRIIRKENEFFDFHHPYIGECGYDMTVREGANKQVISSQADSLIKISRIWADFFPANTSNQPI
ncbi:hypothetical protein AB6S00_011525 [Enterobacter hormaechei]